MIHLTGDTHGRFDRIEAFCQSRRTAPEDVLVILGDAGINYGGTKQDIPAKTRLARMPITLLCIHGNHERRPETIPSYKEAEAFGGAVFREPDFPNLLFARDGEIYDLGGRRCIAIGGAYSVDKYHRLRMGAKWWPDEQPSPATKSLVEARLEQEGWRMDVVLTHTCPITYMPQEAFLDGIDQRTIDESTELWLDTIEERLDYRQWYCGHFHIDKAVDRMCFMFNNVQALEA
jgi:3-oxoacid CoA-transferase subunit A